jgi:anti-sigma-K factor RskA
VNENRSPQCPLNGQAVGWALHALEPDEEMSVVEHLPQCTSCRKAAREAEEVLSSLGVAVEQVEPPPSLRESLMARVAESPQRSASVQPAADLDGPEPAPEPTAAPKAARHREEDRKNDRPRDSRPAARGPWLSRRSRRLVAAALALVGVLAIGGLAVRNAQLVQQRDVEVAQAERLAGLVDQLGRPGVQHALLARDDGSTIAAVLVENGQRQVFPIGIPTNAVDRDTYVLWGIAEGSSSPKALGTFDVVGDAEGLMTVGWTDDSESYVVYAISLEPGRTAPASPTTVVAKGPVQA